MAENAMQGIMGLENAPQMANQAPPMAPPPMPEVTRDQFLAFERARQEIPPGEFANDILQAGEEVDPAAVQELRRDLTGLNLPLELILAMLTMVEGLLAEPGNYAQLRQELLAEGVPEDLLPEQFDGEFFGAMQLALEQMINMQPQTGQPIQAFAEGGLASLRPIAKELQSFGRNGDTILAHINPAEARMLQRMGGSGTINPVTGLREYIFKGVGKVFKGIGKAFKAVGKAVSNAVKGLVKGVTKFVKSPVGKIMTAVALGYFLGPAAASMIGVSSTVGVAAVSGVIGGFGSSMLGGDNLKTSLRNGAIGGVLAGAGAGVMGGAEAFASGSYAGPTTISGQWEQLKSGVTNAFGGPPVGGAEALPVDLPGAVPSTPLDPLTSTATPTISAPTTPTIGAAPSVTPPTSGVSMPTGGIGLTPTGAPTGGVGLRLPSTGTMPSVSAPITPTVGAPPPQAGFFDRALDFFSPSTPTAAQANQVGMNALAEANKAAASQGLTLTSEVQNSIFNKAVEKATPGILRQYGPLVAGGLGIMSLTGGFDEQDTGPQTSQYDQMKASLNPEDYKINLGPVQTTYVDQPQYQDFYASMAQNPFAPQNMQAQNQFGGMPPPMRLSDGGQADFQNFPRKTGPINGPGTEKSDSIPAMLSDGEFVYTAKAVRGAGNGSRREGAKRMYQMMKEFERNA
jgi:hypothetical protein